jgi:hypothetical protein
VSNWPRRDGWTVGISCVWHSESEAGAPPSAASLRAEDSERTRSERAVSNVPTKAQAPAGCQITWLL